MEIIKTKFAGLTIIKPKVFFDDRGYFFESYNYQKLKQETQIEDNFVQDNQSLSNGKVIRGLHFQNPNFAQAKLIRVIQGKILDFVVDIRLGSPTFLEFFSIILDSDNFYQLYIPEGFAHGFLTLADNNLIQYKCNQFYNKESEGGLLALPILEEQKKQNKILSKLLFDEYLISEKDKNWQLKENLKTSFVFDRQKFIQWKQDIDTNFFEVK